MRAPDDLTMRPLSQADLRFVRALATEAFAEYDGGIAAARVTSMLTGPGTRAVVADLAGRAVGFAAVQIERGRAHLTVIAVARDVRGRGIGGRLLREAERRAAAAGARTMTLETGEANLAAMDLFMRAGYTREGRVPRYYRTGYDALRFVKRLDP